MCPMYFLNLDLDQDALVLSLVFVDIRLYQGFQHLDNNFRVSISSNENGTRAQRMTRNPFRAQPDNRRTSTSHPFSQTSRTTAPRDGPGSPFFSRHRASTGSLPTSDSTPRQRSGETGQPASSAGSVRYLADDILGLNRWLSTLSTQNTAETPSRSDSVGGLYPIPSPALNTSSRPNPSRTATIPQQSRPDTLRTGSRARCKIVIGIDFGTT